MKHRFLPFAAFLLLISFAAGASAQDNYYYLPQIANGDYGTGIYKTTFVLFNNSNSTVYAFMDLTDNDGNPLAMTISDYGTDSSFYFTLPAGATKFLQTDGKGSVTTGVATVYASSSIGVSAIFSIYDSSGHYKTETGVGNSEPQTSFMLPVDSTGSFNTGLALYNSSYDVADITLTLRNTSGAIAGTASLQMDPGQHVAKYVSGTDQFFPSAGAMQGTLSVESSVPIAALVLRQYSSSTALSFTTLPAFPTSSTETTLHLAQVGDGGGYQTSFLIFNISSSPANVTINLKNDGGNAMNVTMLNGSSGSTFTVNNLAPGASAFLQTDGKPSSVSTGAATITSNVPVGASGVFTITSGGVFQTETGVGDSPLLSSFTIPVDITGTFNTGVAFFNPGSTTATIKLRRLDDSGAQIGSEVTYPSAPLPALGHTAVFIGQVFGVANVRGSVAINSSTPIVAMTLRMNDSPLSYTSLPVVSGVSAGGGGAATTLLEKIESGINATTNITKNETLNSGYKLSGTVTGSTATGSVIAQSGQTQAFSGTISSGRYQIVLPAGTYNLTAMYAPNGIASNTLIITSTVASGVTVTADTTRDITLPATTLYTVTGTVNGLGNFGATTGMEMHFTTANGSINGSFPLSAGGSYSGSLPAGSYAVGVDVSMNFNATGQNQSLGIYNLGNATIGGNTSLPAYSIGSLVKLSGMVKGVSIPVTGIGISATTSNEAIVSTSNADMLTAQYQALLPPNTYNVNMTMAMIQGTSWMGSITYPLNPTALTLSKDTSGYDFTVPSLPPRVTISGKVTDSDGSPVSGAAIILYCESVTSVPNLSFVNSAQTDSSGNYSVSVLSGTDYTIAFMPPTQ
jgi:hypothetical protein